MTIQTPVIAEADPWPATQAAVNAWRGQCVAHLARAEAAVSETLLVLAQVQDRGAKIKLPLMIGERCGVLAKAIAADGPFHAEGKDLIASLDAYRAHAPLRNFLCHAPGKITRDRRGRWMLVLRILTFRSNRPERDVRLVEEAESGELLDRLGTDCQRLVNQLAGLRKKLA